MDRLAQIFQLQMQLMDKYESIEKSNGHHLEARSNWSRGLDLDARFDQARIKDTAYRMTEELGEALDAWDNEPASYPEEMADVMHFITELTILSGLKYDDINWQAPNEHGDQLHYLWSKAKFMSSDNVIEEDLTDDQLINICTSQVIQSLAMTCNCLKNKPWSQRQRETDKKLYYDRLRQLWVRFAQLCRAAGMTSDMIHELYVEKAGKNVERQNTGY